MRKFFESEILIDCLFDCKERLNINIEAQSFIQKLNVDQADKINDLLVKLLESDFADDIISIEDSKLPPNTEEGFGLRFRKIIKNNEVKTLRFFRINKTVNTGSISLVALLVAIKTLNPFGVIPGIGVVKSVINNIVTLKRSKSSNAIDVYEIIIKLMLEKDTEVISSNEIFSHTEMTNRGVQNGLNELDKKELIEVKSWGKEQFDYTHSENLWSITF